MGFSHKTQAAVTRRIDFRADEGDYGYPITTKYPQSSSIHWCGSKQEVLASIELVRTHDSQGHERGQVLHI